MTLVVCIGAINKCASCTLQVEVVWMMMLSGCNRQAVIILVVCLVASLASVDVADNDHSQLQVTIILLTWRALCRGLIYLLVIQHIGPKIQVARQHVPVSTFWGGQWFLYHPMSPISLPALRCYLNSLHVFLIMEEFQQIEKDVYGMVMATLMLLSAKGKCFTYCVLVSLNCLIIVFSVLAPHLAAWRSGELVRVVAQLCLLKKLYQGKITKARQKNLLAALAGSGSRPIQISYHWRSQGSPGAWPNTLTENDTSGKAQKSPKSLSLAGLGSIKYRAQCNDHFATVKGKRS